MPPVDWRLRYVALALIWGSSFLFIVIGVEVLAALHVALARVALGTIALSLILLIRREQIPRGWMIWGHLAVVGFFYNALPFTLLAYAAERIPSSLSGILNATTPIFTLLVAFLVLKEGKNRWQTIGILCGFAGVVVIMAGDLGGLPGTLSDGYQVGVAFVLGASACYGAASVYTRRFLTDSGYSTVSLSVGQVACATVQLGLITPWFTQAPGHLPPRVVLAMLALGALGTGVSYALYYGLIRDAGATMASTVTYLFPVVAPVLGVLLYGEILTWNQVAGGATIIFGAILTRRSTKML
ncbi:DMT family transporter [Nonomuraea sp. B19D2]|uniref:DMT family transporter n=1 Tax=Nonomuraea sp. B19D2 TaxID=3159561 RepID=UPI0032DB1297